MPRTHGTNMDLVRASYPDAKLVTHPVTCLVRIQATHPELGIPFPLSTWQAGNSRAWLLARRTVETTAALRIAEVTQ